MDESLSIEPFEEEKQIDSYKVKHQYQSHNDLKYSVQSKNQSKNSESQSQTKFRCLIANDDPSQLYILKFLFTQSGFEVTTAINGFEAYQKVIKSI